MDLATVTALFRYNSWANDQVLDATSRVTEAEFIRDLKSSHGSLRDTVMHILSGEWIWLQRWKAGASPKLPFSSSDFPDVESVRQRLHAVAEERFAFLRDLADERLLEVKEYRNVKGELWRHVLWQQLCHMVNHSTYHRGQVVTMLRQLGAAAPATDLLIYYDQGGS